jgi:hypothetical protein
VTVYSKMLSRVTGVPIVPLRTPTAAGAGVSRRALVPYARITPAPTRIAVTRAIHGQYFVFGA